jgi:cytochrome c oxidase assembly factor CtaG
MMRTFLSTLYLVAGVAATARAHDGDHQNTGADLVFPALLLTSAAIAIFSFSKSRSAFALVCGAVVAAVAVSWLAFAPTGTFAGHMLAQMILMDVAAPLVVLAQVPPFAAKAFIRWPSFLRHRDTSESFLVAGIIHAATMWIWHVPAFYRAVMGAPLLHGVMQLSFLAAGLIFWAMVVRARGNKSGIALFWLFMMAMHTGFLGALLTFAPTPLYGGALEDQQIGGLIMWVFGTGIYALAGLCIAARWLAAQERAQSERSA